MEGLGVQCEEHVKQEDIPCEIQLDNDAGEPASICLHREYIQEIDKVRVSTTNFIVVKPPYDDILLSELTVRSVYKFSFQVLEYMQKFDIRLPLACMLSEAVRLILLAEYQLNETQFYSLPNSKIIHFVRLYVQPQNNWEFIAEFRKNVEFEWDQNTIGLNNIIDFKLAILRYCAKAINVVDFLSTYYKSSTTSMSSMSSLETGLIEVFLDKISLNYGREINDGLSQIGDCDGFTYFNKYLHQFTKSVQISLRTTQSVVSELRRLHDRCQQNHNTNADADIIVDNGVAADAIIVDGNADNVSGAADADADRGVRAVLAEVQTQVDELQQRLAVIEMSNNYAGAGGGAGDVARSNNNDVAVADTAVASTATVSTTPSSPSSAPHSTITNTTTTSTTASSSLSSSAPPSSSSPSSPIIDGYCCVPISAASHEEVNPYIGGVPIAVSMAVPSAPYVDVFTIAELEGLYQYNDNESGYGHPKDGYDSNGVSMGSGAVSNDMKRGASSGVTQPRRSAHASSSTSVSATCIDDDDNDDDGDVIKAVPLGPSPNGCFGMVLRNVCKNETCSRSHDPAVLTKMHEYISRCLAVSKYKPKKCP